MAGKIQWRGMDSENGRISPGADFVQCNGQSAMPGKEGARGEVWRSALPPSHTASGLVEETWRWLTRLPSGQIVCEGVADTMALAQAQVENRLGVA